jgi:long-chain acyl-CoA synthetase
MGMDMSQGVACLIASSVARHPGKTAIIERDRPYSYGYLEQTVSKLAALFDSYGLAGERVALMLPNSLEILCCYLACFRMGAVATPVNYRYAPPELERAITHARPKWLIIHSSRLDVLAKVTPAVAATCRIFVVGSTDSLDAGMTRFESLMAEAAPSRSFNQPPADSAAVMFFTSGSTGRPKGVLHSQSSVRAILDSTADAFGGIRSDDLIQVVEPEVHVSGFIDSLTILMGGGTAVLLDAFEEAHYIASMRRWRPTLICTHIDLVVKLMHWPGARREDFASLRGVFTGGERVAGAWQKQFRDLTGLPIQVGWGLTEAIWLTICREPGLDQDGCIGRPVANVELRVTDPSGQDLPPGEVGELRVRGPMVMQRYWEDPEETAKALEAGWLRTGDSGWRDAGGTWWFASRLKELIVRNTSKITPGEVEAALNGHEAVDESGVVGIPDPGEGEVPVAFVVLKPGKTVGEAELMTFLEGRIARYKIPVRIRFLDTLPLTRSGKLNHLALKTMATAPV